MPPKRGERATGSSRLKLDPSRVPDDLAPVADLIVAFWNHHKAGQRTQRALSAQITHLRKILSDPRGGLPAVRAQLQKAITAGELGRRWSGITFDRWQEFGLSGSVQQKPTAASTVPRDFTPIPDYILANTLDVKIRARTTTAT